MTEIEFNTDFQKAWELIEEQGRNVFVTGRAGTGKSTLLSYFKNNTSKKTVILAPTGVAASNVGGQQFIHFLGLSQGLPWIRWIKLRFLISGVVV